MSRAGARCLVTVHASVTAATEIGQFRIGTRPLVALEFEGTEGRVSLHIGLPEIARIRAELNKAELELAVVQSGPDIRRAAPEPDAAGESDDV